MVCTFSHPFFHLLIVCHSFLLQVPQLFVAGKYVGGEKEIPRFHESGELRRILSSAVETWQKGVNILYYCAAWQCTTVRELWGTFLDNNTLHTNFQGVHCNLYFISYQETFECIYKDYNNVVCENGNKEKEQAKTAKFNLKNRHGAFDTVAIASVLALTKYWNSKWMLGLC